MVHNSRIKVKTILKSWKWSNKFEKWEHFESRMKVYKMEKKCTKVTLSPYKGCCPHQTVFLCGRGPGGSSAEFILPSETR